MLIKPIQSAAEWQELQASVATFMRSYGNRRITHTALRWLRSLPPTAIEEPGTYILTARSNQRLVGALALADYGRRHACIAVHRRLRRQGVGRQLLEATLEEVPIMYASAAADNLASIKLCFQCGLWAYRITEGPTGKPTLNFVGGREMLPLQAKVADASPPADSPSSP